MLETKSWDQYSEEEILEANVVKYNNEHIIKFYTDFEEPKYSYIEYEVVFSAILNLLTSKLSHPIRAVDMCGGAGKAAFVVKKLQLNSIVTLVDVAEKMLDIAKIRMEKENISDLEIVNADAFGFLEEDREFDLIIFSSAIHHFKDPVDLLSKASKRLSDNGFIITIADPTTIIKSKRYKFFEFLAVNSDGKKQIMKKCFSNTFTKTDSKIPDENFDLAEYQTYLGINDMKLKQDLANMGLSTLVHMRYPAGEPFMTKIMPFFGLCWAFSLILYKGNLENRQEVASSIKQIIKKNLPFRIKYF